MSNVSDSKKKENEPITTSDIPLMPKQKHILQLLSFQLMCEQQQKQTPPSQDNI